LLGGPILTALSSFLIVGAQSFPALLAFRFVAGWAAQMWMLSRIVIIADTGRSQQRGRQISGLAGMDSVGKLMGPAVGGVVATLWGIRAPFLVYGLLAILAIIPSFKLIQETAPVRTAARTAESRGRSLPTGGTLAALLSVPILMLFLARAFESVTRGARQGGTLDLYAAYAYNAGPAVLGVMGTLAGLFGVPIIFTAGYLMDRFGRKATLVPGFSLLGVAYGLMTLTALFHLPFLAFLTAFLAVSASQSLTGGNMQTLGSDMAPANARGQFMGVYNFISQTGQTLSPVIFALLAERAGYPASFLFLCLTGSSTALILATQVRETLRREPVVAAQAPAAEEAAARLP
jgi:MFS family permease